MGPPLLLSHARTSPSKAACHMCRVRDQLIVVVRAHISPQMTSN
jgi:hypothetical protein